VHRGLVRIGPPAALLAVLLAAGLLLAGCSGPAPAGLPGAAPGTAVTVAVPRGALAEGTFTVDDGADALDVTVADLGADLVRVSTSSDVRPDVRADAGTVDLHLAKPGDAGPADVRVVLARGVRWRFVLAAGAGELSLDLSGGRVGGVDVDAGVGRITMRLPAPDGTVPLRMSAGTSSWRLERPADVPVRVRAGAGAGAVRLDGEAREGVAAGTELRAPGWDDARDRYDVDAAAGVADLVVSATPASS
jgi:hypothetical protein